jgi:hypothetical protein
MAWGPAHILKFPYANSQEQPKKMTELGHDSYTDQSASFLSRKDNVERASTSGSSASDFHDVDRIALLKQGSGTAEALHGPPSQSDNKLGLPDNSDGRFAFLDSSWAHPPSKAQIAKNLDTYVDGLIDRAERGPRANSQERTAQLQKMSEFLTRNYDRLSQFVYPRVVGSGTTYITGESLVNFALRSKDVHEQRMIGSILKNYGELAALFTDDLPLGITREDVYAFRRIVSPERTKYSRDPFYTGMLDYRLMFLGAAGGGLSAGFVGAGGGPLGCFAGTAAGFAAGGFAGHLVARGIYRAVYGSSDKYYAGRAPLINQLEVPKEY